MSPRQWFALFAFYISYLFFGASVFYTSEQQLETARRAVELQERIQINEILTKYTAPDNIDLQEDIFKQVNEYCGRKVSNHTKDEYVDPYIWSFYHSFFFSFIVCSTVGYGNITPNNTFGRIFMIFYALVGIPVNGILFAYMGDFFGKTYLKLYARYKSYKLANDENYVPRKLNLIGQIALYLIPAIIVFIFIPAIFFTYFEDWDYSISVYYAFVTLTTIGFGDFVPTFQAHQERTFGPIFIVYQIFIIVWFIIGVGYLVMVVGFLTKGLRSKKMRGIEHQLALNLKETQHKIWHGVTKDVGYLRKILNEVYFMKFKPVYRDPEEIKRMFQHPKSSSCPNLSMYSESSEGPLCARKRALSVTLERLGSEEVTKSLPALHRRQSDSDLSKIDKNKTFDIRNAAVQPGEFLANVVFALNSFRGDEEREATSVSDMGVQGFTDSQILASEQNWSNWSIETSERSYPSPMRQRAISEIRIPMEDDNKPTHEWTWSGANTQMKEIEKMRSQAAIPKESLYKSSLKTKLRYDSETGVNFPSELPPKPNMSPVPPNKSIFNTFNMFKRRMSSTPTKDLEDGQDNKDIQKYLKGSMKGRQSVNPVNSSAKQYLKNTMGGRKSMFNMAVNEDQNLLETTTIADLIRALEMMHTEANSGVSSSQESIRQLKNRKLGTDHLSNVSIHLNHLTPRRNTSLMTLLPNSLDSSMTVGPISDSRRMPHRQRLYSCMSTPPTTQCDNRGLIIGENSPFARKTSIRSFHPPPYSPLEPPSHLKRRFSVRPSNLSVPIGEIHNRKQLNTSGIIPTPPPLPYGLPLDQWAPLRPSPLTMQSTGGNNMVKKIWRNKFGQGLTSSNSLHNLCEDKIKEMERKRTDSN